MAPHAISVAQFDPDANAADAITVEELANVLPKPTELAKAAIMPSPALAAPLRVVDRVTPTEPAGYWLNFLGAQQLPRQPLVSRMLVEAGQGSLVAEGVPPDLARSVVAERLEEVAAAREPIEPRAFFDGLAALANRPAQQVWDRAARSHGDLANPHVRVSPTATARLKTVIQLGDDIVLSGPATAMGPPRVEMAQDADGWFVTVRAIAEPIPRPQ